MVGLFFRCLCYRVYIISNLFIIKRKRMRESTSGKRKVKINVIVSYFIGSFFEKVQVWVLSPHSFFSQLTQLVWYIIDIS